jgi:hypothetical protein
LVIQTKELLMVATADPERAGEFFWDPVATTVVRLNDVLTSVT